MTWRLAGALILLAGTSLRGADDTQCLTCHQEKQEQFAGSVHAAVGCTGCHSQLGGIPHAESVPSVNCAGCHADQGAALNGSVHKKVGEQPCLSCHGDAHGIVPVKDSHSPVYALNLPRTCGECHGGKQVSTQKRRANIYSAYLDSIHGFALTKDGLLVAATCSSCHGAHDILAPTNPKSRIYKTNVPDTCGSCHEGIAQQYKAGAHGKALAAGNQQAPVCTSCHTAHQIAGVRDVSFQEKTPATCGGCHRERYGTYRDTFHGHVSALGYVEVAHCWDCHSAHEVLPASDAKSTVARGNLIGTCGKCHTGVSASFVSYSPHADPNNGRKYPALHVASIFMNFLLSGVLGFFTLHTALWFIRSRKK